MRGTISEVVAGTYGGLFPQVHSYWQRSGRDTGDDTGLDGRGFNWKVKLGNSREVEE